MMVMQLKPDYIAANCPLRTIKPAMARSGAAEFPYQCLADFYVQAQLVMVNTCDSGGCLDQADFVAAINNGTYPSMTAPPRKN